MYDFLDKLDTKATSRPDEVRANCPFCHIRTPWRAPDNKYHLGISLRPDLPACHCFRCGYSAHLAIFCRSLGLDIRRLPSRLKTPYKPKEIQTPSFQAKLPDEYSLINENDILHRKPLEYLQGRGVSFEQINSYRIGYCVLGPYAQRIIFPVYEQARLVGFTARLVTEGQPKYKNPAGFHKSDFLYNFDSALHFDTVIIVEGVFDAIRLPNSVALFGKELSDKQRLKIVKTWKHVNVLLDSDAAEDAMMVGKLLAPYVSAIVCQLPLGTDPATATNGELEHALANPVDLEALLC